MSTTRLETFADGVFAIAATLLIIDVALPAGVDDALGAELLAFVSPEASAVLFGLLALFYVVSSALLGGVARPDDRRSA